MVKPIAIITARGGSKRIPKKNIKEFFGKPMIAYAIAACRESGIFSSVMVSTDSEEIAGIARANGAEVPFMRSEATASDFATTYDVLAEVLTEYANANKKFDSICCVYPCVPFLTGETLRSAYAQFSGSAADGLQPVCRYPAPVEWAMKLENGYLVPNDRAALSIRSQDLSPKYFDAGMFYFVRVKALLAEKTPVPAHTLGYIMNESEIQDIDTQEDWHEAEIKYRIRRGK